MQISVNNYSLEPEIVDVGTSGSYGIESLSFTFDSSWDGLTKSVAFFTQGGSPIRIDLGETDTVSVPQEMTLYGGNGSFVVIGVAEGIQKVSVTGTVRVAPTQSFELFEVEPDKISPAFADFLLLYNELSALADSMVIELTYDEGTNTIRWRYTGSDEYHTLAALSDLSLSARFEGENLIVTTPTGDLPSIRVKGDRGSSWLCGEAEILQSGDLFTAPISDDGLSLITSGDMYVSTKNLDIFRCDGKTADNVNFSKICSLADALGRKQIGCGAVPTAKSHFMPLSDAVVYLDDSGSVTNTGLTADSPFGNLAQAVAALPLNGGRVRIVSQYTNSASLTLYHSGRVLVEGLTSDSLFLTSSLTFGSDFSFSNLKIKTSADYVFFNAMGNSLAMLDGITILSPETASGIKLGIRGGGDSPVATGKTAQLAIFSGSYSAIIAGGRADMAANSVIEMYGGSAIKVKLGADGNVGEFTGNGYYIVNGNAEVSSVFGDTYLAATSGKGGYITYDGSGFMLYTPSVAQIVQNTGNSFYSETAYVPFTTGFSVTHSVKWDFAETKNASLVLAGEDMPVTVIGAPIGSTGVLQVTGGLLDNTPKDGLPRDGKLEYTATVRENGVSWSVCRLSE